MTSARRLLLAACGLAAVGCGSSADGGGTPATCAVRMVTLAGELDGQPIAVQVSLTSLLFQQVSTPYTLDVGYANGMLHLEWNVRVPENRGGAAATGTVVMPAGAPHAGETICAGSGSIRETADSTGAQTNQIFTLGTLSSGASCPGAALAGSISGCVGG